MINRFSASASEIAAAALQDYGRALVVGDISTHGKGTVQNLNPLKQFMPGLTNDPGTIKITIRKFYRVSGASTQLKGVTPDIVLPDVLNYSDQIGEASLENPLPWDTIRPVNFEKFNLVQPFLSTLKTQSDERIATNQDFRYVRQDIDQFRKVQDEKTATINEQEAIKERQDAYKRNKDRDDERIARKAPGAKVYEITLKNIDQPGLTLAGATNDVASAGQKSSDTNNTAAIAKAGLPHGAKPAVADKDKKSAPPFDPMLDETQQILLDYIALLAKSAALAATGEHPATGDH
jgi:carboxyl-terminal processing protease